MFLSFIALRIYFIRAENAINFNGFNVVVIFSRYHQTIDETTKVDDNI